MADAYQYTFGGLDVLDRLARQAPQVFEAEVSSFLSWATELLQGEVVDRTPTAAGALRKNIIGRVEVSASGMLGVVGTTVDYAPAIEFGTKPHPVSEEGILAIAEWALRKLPLGQAVSIKTGRALKTPGIEDAALAAAHAIAWKIRTKGSQGAFMFRDAFAANRARVTARWEAMVARAVQHLGGSA